MENQEGDELLLSRAWETGGRTAVCENTEASEQLDAENGRDRHGSRLHANCEHKVLRTALETPVPG
jgi:hypothetical protein